MCFLKTLSFPKRRVYVYGNLCHADERFSSSKILIRFTRCQDHQSWRNLLWDRARKNGNMHARGKFIDTLKSHYTFNLRLNVSKQDKLQINCLCSAFGSKRSVKSWEAPVFCLSYFSITYKYMFFTIAGRNSRRLIFCPQRNFVVSSNLIAAFIILLRLFFATTWK